MKTSIDLQQAITSYLDQRLLEDFGNLVRSNLLTTKLDGSPTRRRVIKILQADKPTHLWLNYPDSTSDMSSGACQYIDLKELLKQSGCQLHPSWPFYRLTQANVNLNLDDWLLNHPSPYCSSLAFIVDNSLRLYRPIYHNHRTGIGPLDSAVDVKYDTFESYDLSDPALMDNLYGAVCYDLCSASFGVAYRLVDAAFRYSHAACNSRQEDNDYNLSTVKCEFDSNYLEVIAYYNRLKIRNRLEDAKQEIRFNLKCLLATIERSSMRLVSKPGSLCCDGDALRDFIENQYLRSIIFRSETAFPRSAARGFGGSGP